MSSLIHFLELVEEALVKIIDEHERDFSVLRPLIIEIGKNMPTALQQFSEYVSKVFTFFNAVRVLEIWLTGLFNTLPIEDIYSILAKTYVTFRETEAIEPTAWIVPPGEARVIRMPLRPELKEKGVVLTLNDLFEAFGGALATAEYMRDKCNFDIFPEFAMRDDEPYIIWHKYVAKVERFEQIKEFTEALISAVNFMIQAIFTMLTTDYELRLKILPSDLAEIVEKQVPSTRPVEVFSSVFKFYYYNGMRVRGYCWNVNEPVKRGKKVCFEEMVDEFIEKVDKLAEEIIPEDLRLKPPYSPERKPLRLPGSGLPWGFILDATKIWDKIGGYEKAFAKAMKPVPVYLAHIPSALHTTIPKERNPCEFFLAMKKSELVKIFARVFKVFGTYR